MADDKDAGWDPVFGSGCFGAVVAWIVAASVAVLGIGYFMIIK